MTPMQVPHDPAPFPHPCPSSSHCSWAPHRLALDRCLLLTECELHVARAGHVGVDATVGAVRAAALLHGLVDLDVADEQRINVKALGLLRGAKRAVQCRGGGDGGSVSAQVC